jgi:LytR cell envelope-related transcriptional attenuator
MTATRPPGFDDRFTTPIEASRRGAHRARPRPGAATLPVLAGIAVILIVAVVGYGFARGGSDSDDSKSNQLAASASEPSATAKPPADAAAAGKPSPTDAAAGDSGDAGDGGDGADAGDEVDHSIKLKVLNSTSTQGLAKRVAGDIEGNDWTVVGTGNWSRKNLATSKVYYGKDTVKATAEAVRKDLGYGTVVKDSSVTTSGITVVLGLDAS